MLRSFIRRVAFPILTAAVALGAGASAPLPVPTETVTPSAAVTEDAGFSLMSYNVHGLPWPLATGRPQAMGEIAARLRSLRAEGRQPHVVVLQEAFTDTARQIFRGAGYAYSATGPTASLGADTAATADDRTFEQHGRWLKGEGVGRVLGSGLMVLSDYPIVAVRRAAFPAFACAGFDCLANKGAMIATLRLPGGREIEVATTHLNSRAAAGVGKPRSDRAFERQIELLGRFVTADRDARVPLVVAGDFNVGKSAVRRDIMAANSAGWSADRIDAPVENTLQADCALVGATGPRQVADWAIVKRRAKDWQFYTAGALGTIKATALSITFGHEADGSMLSDHIGYIAHYVLEAPKLARFEGRRLAA